MKFIFNYTRVTKREESIVVGSLIISSSFNHEFVITYANFYQVFPIDLTDEHKLYIHLGHLEIGTWSTCIASQ